MDAILAKYSDPPLCRLLPTSCTQDGSGLLCEEMIRQLHGGTQKFPRTLGLCGIVVVVRIVSASAIMLRSAFRSARFTVVTLRTCALSRVFYRPAQMVYGVIASCLPTRFLWPSLQRTAGSQTPLYPSTIDQSSLLDGSRHDQTVRCYGRHGQVLRRLPSSPGHDVRAWRVSCWREIGPRLL